MERGKEVRILILFFFCVFYLMYMGNSLDLVDLPIKTHLTSLPNMFLPI